MQYAQDLNNSLVLTWTCPCARKVSKHPGFVIEVPRECVTTSAASLARILHDLQLTILVPLVLENLLDGD
eukprot:3036726-Amphidinium_carterae.1